MGIYIGSVNLGGILLDMGLVGAALNVLNRKIRRNPRNALAHLQRGDAKFALGDTDGALADYDMALQLDIARMEQRTIHKGIEAIIHTQRGQVYFDQKYYPQALEALENAQKLNADFHATLAWQAITHYALGNFEVANRLWESACYQYPGYSILDGSNWIYNQPGWVMRHIEEAKKITALLNASR